MCPQAAPASLPSGLPLLMKSGRASFVALPPRAAPTCPRLLWVRLSGGSLHTRPCVRMAKQGQPSGLGAARSFSRALSSPLFFFPTDGQFHNLHLLSPSNER